MVMPASRWAPRPCAGVAGFPWNQWQLCYGISGNFRVEQVAALAWNRWQDSPGIGGSFGVEYALGDEEIDALYGRPRFTPDERQEYFAFAPAELAALGQFRSHPSGLYSLLQLGYFKARQ